MASPRTRTRNCLLILKRGRIPMMRLACKSSSMICAYVLKMVFSWVGMLHTLRLSILILSQFWIIVFMRGYIVWPTPRSWVIYVVIVLSAFFFEISVMRFSRTHLQLFRRLPRNSWMIFMGVILSPIVGSFRSHFMISIKTLRRAPWKVISWSGLVNSPWKILFSLRKNFANFLLHIPFTFDALLSIQLFLLMFEVSSMISIYGRTELYLVAKSFAHWPATVDWPFGCSRQYGRQIASANPVIFERTGLQYAIEECFIYQCL